MCTEKIDLPKLCPPPQYKQKSSVIDASRTNYRYFFFGGGGCVDLIIRFEEKKVKTNIFHFVIISIATFSVKCRIQSTLARGDGLQKKYTELKKELMYKVSYTL